MKKILLNIIKIILCISLLLSNIPGYAATSYDGLIKIDNEAPQFTPFGSAIGLNLTPVGDMGTQTPSKITVPLGTSLSTYSNEQTPEILTDDDGKEIILSQNKEVELRGAGPILSASTYDVSMYKGDKKTVTFTLSGYSGKVDILTTITPARQVDLYRRAQGNNVCHYDITGLNVGDAFFEVYAVAAGGRIVAETNIYVHILPSERPSLTLSSYNESFMTGEEKTVYLKLSHIYNNVQICIYNSDDRVMSIDASGYTSGYTIPLKIRGLSAGTARLDICYETLMGTKYAQASFIANVYNPIKPTIDMVTEDELTLYLGASTKTIFSIKNMTSEYHLACRTNDVIHFRCDETINNNLFNVVFTGRNIGNGSYSLMIMDKNNSVVDAETVAIKVIDDNRPKISLSPTSVSVAQNSSKSVTISFTNSNDVDEIGYSCKNGDIITITSPDVATSNSVQINVHGTEVGDATIRFALLKNGHEIAVTSLRVQVTDFYTDIKNLRLGFSNESVNYIGRDICNYMYGDNRIAEEIYDMNSGNGGVCFGMSTASMLISSDANNLAVKNFNRNKKQTYTISKTDYNSNIGLSLFKFVQAMHISQFSTLADDRNKTGVNNIANAVIAGTNAHKPVAIGIRGDVGYVKDAGHRVVAYGYTIPDNKTMEIKIYDPNTSHFTTMTLKKSYAGGSYTSWSYNIFDGVTWGTGKSNNDIYYLTYDDVLSIWNSHGSLTKSGFNLFWCTDKSFRLYNFDGDLVAKYSNGALVQKSDEVIEIKTNNYVPGSENTYNVKMLYIPIDYYTIEDDSPEDGIEATISDKDLSISVETEADSVELCADGYSDAVNTIFTADNSDFYRVEICSSRDDESDSIEVKGIGMGQLLGVGLINGNISLSGADSSSIGITTVEKKHYISAYHTPGGSVSTGESSEYFEGDNCLVLITPDEGCIIDTVYVDGVNVGAADKYYFENITESHDVYAIFKQGLSSCNIDIGKDSYVFEGKQICPTVTVTSPDGTVLEEGEDYILSYENNATPGTATVYILATENSSFTGHSEKIFTITERNKITNVTVDHTTNKVFVEIQNQDKGCLIAAVFGRDKNLVSVKEQQIPEGVHNKEFEFNESLRDCTVKVFLLDSLNNIRPLAIYSIP